MSQENEIEAEKLNLTKDFLPSDGASCCVSSGAGYRLLKPGERLQKNDEGLHEEDGKWHEVGWLFSACDYVPGFMVPIRRKCEHCTEGYVQDAGFVECNHCNSPHNAGSDAPGANEKP